MQTTEQDWTTLAAIMWHWLAEDQGEGKLGFMSTAEALEDLEHVIEHACPPHSTITCIILKHCHPRKVRHLTALQYSYDGVYNCYLNPCVLASLFLVITMLSSRWRQCDYIISYSRLNFWHWTKNISIYNRHYLCIVSKQNIILYTLT